MDQEQRVKEVIIRALELSIEPDDLDTDTSLAEDGIGLDSVSTLEVVVGLEEAFGFEIEDEELTEDIFVSIHSLTDFVGNKLAQKQPRIEQGSVA